MRRALAPADAVTAAREVPMYGGRSSRMIVWAMAVPAFFVAVWLLLDCANGR